jgi:poly(A) polymerase
MFSCYCRDWPLPVLLRNIEEGQLAVRVWNPKIYPQDKAHRMPVITPSYPSMCSTHNVTSSTQAVTTDEFECAADTADKILLGQDKWSSLFKKHDFFHKYKHYLQVVASCDNQDEHLQFDGMVESRLRQLVNKLELVDQINRAHPFIKGFDLLITCNSAEEEGIISRGDIPVTVELKSDLLSRDALDGTKDMDNVKDEGSSEHPNGSVSSVIGNKRKDGSIYPKPMWVTTFYVGLQIKPKDPLNPSRHLDISWPSSEFIKLVKSWDKYDGEKMAITVRCIKKYFKVM